MGLRQVPALAVILATALLSIYSHAQSAPPTANGYTQQASPNAVDGTGGAMDFLGLQAGSNAREVFIQFNLADIPAGASVQKATLQLYVNLVIDPGTFDVYQVNSEWNQSTLTYANAPSLGESATGNHPVAIPAAADQFILIDVTPLVQDWVNGTVPNNGLALAMTTSSGGVLFDSKETTTTSHMPELQIVLSGQAGPQGPAGQPGLTGPAGTTGPQGPAGPQGPMGQPGLNGAPGTIGPQGPAGPQGTTGPGFNFRNAFNASSTYAPYDVVTYNGSTYDALAAIAPGGVTPDQNTSWALMAQQGSTGPAGTTGPQGPIGLSGAAGPAGPQGLQGVPGATGPQGLTGPQGTTGPGFNFRNAFDATATYAPYDVVAYNGSTYDALAAIAPGGVTPDQNTSWALMAQQGGTGPAGATGPQGAIGLTGAAGPQGIQGVPGATGATGPPGPIGLTGATGAAGPQGVQGIPGATGPQGLTGPQGTAGPGFNFRNAFDPTATYAPYDVVTYNGSTYDALAAIAPGGATPDQNTSWTVMAQQGAKGAAGAAGPNSLSATTTSTFNGIIKGSGGALAPAIAGTDYVVPSGNITGNAATANQLSSTGPNGTVWGVSGGVQGYYQPGILQILSPQPSSGGSCQAVTAANGTATVNWATSTCAVITASGSNVTSITLSNPSSGQAYSLGLCNDGAPRTWSLPGTLKQASMPQYASECVYKIYTFDGVNFQGPGSTANPTVIYGTERSAPTSAAQGAFVCWWDNTNHVMTCNDNGGSIANMVVPATGATSNQFVSYIDSAGIQHMAQAGGGSGTVTSSGSPAAGNISKFSSATNIVPATAADIIGLFSSCSGSQYLGADGSCHSAVANAQVASGGSSGGGVSSVQFVGDGVLDSAAPSTADTGSGTVAATILNQNANTALWGPTSGSAAAPTFRSEVVADLPVGTVYSVTPAEGSSDTVTCASANGAYVPFSTTISRPAFTQTAGAKWSLGATFLLTTTSSPPTMGLELKDGSTVIYSNSAAMPLASASGDATSVTFTEEITAPSSGSSTLTATGFGTILNSLQPWLNRTAQATGFTSNTPGTLSILLDCNASTSGNQLTLVSLNLTRIY